MYNSDLVRKLCGDILNAKDPGRVQDLICLLQAVIKEDQEEIRIRMAFHANSTRMPSRTRRLRTRAFQPLPCL
jgi:hypothetical protein